MLCSLLPLLMACSGGATAVTGPGDSPSGTDASLQSVEVQPSELTLQVGESARLSIHGRDDEGQEVSLSARDVDWTSSAPGVASVDSTGLVSALGDGNVSIAARVNPNASDQSMRDSALVIAEPRSGGGGTAGDPADPTNAFRAFPGAEGWGAEALTQCDRSHLQVLHVTNLQDSGAGSLRDAIDQATDNILTLIIFEIAGYIDLQSRIRVDSNCLYIAGQTAPGDGITVRSSGQSLFLAGSTVRDVVIRYLRFRGGHPGERVAGQINLLVGSGHNIILDHLSLGWTTDKLLAITQYEYSWSAPIYNVGVQRTLLHEVFADHPTAVQISSSDRVNPSLSNVAFHHNLLAHNSHRNPNSFTSGLKVVNNVIYNWGQGAGQGEHKAVTDWINNYYKPGPMTAYDYEVTHFISSTDAHPSYYVTGNVGPHNSDDYAGPNSQWEGGSRVVACYYKCENFGDGTAGQPLPDWARRDDPLDQATIPIRTQLATSAYNSVLEDVGANARLNCRGDLVDNRDSVDQRIIDQVRDGTGPSSPPASETDVGGYPSIDPGAPCADSDSDGMPDEYEMEWGFDPSDATDSWSDADGDGYLNIEEFLNASRPM